MKPHPEVHKAHISSAGDRSVGIPPSNYTAEIFIPANERETLEEIRKRLGIIYEVMVDEKVTVLFDFELAEQEALAKKAEDDQATFERIEKRDVSCGAQACRSSKLSGHGDESICSMPKGHQGPHICGAVSWPNTDWMPSLCGAQMKGKHSSDPVHVCTLVRGHRGLHDAGCRRW